MSDIRVLREQIDAECQAAWLALYGLRNAASHEVITAHMENMSRLHDELKEYVGEERAVEILVNSMERSATNDSSL